MGRRSRSRDRSRRVRLASPIPVLLISTLLLACGDDDAGTSTTTGAAPVEGLSVIVDPPRAEAGSTVLASVRNDTERQFTYGADYGLEREVDGGFEAVDLPDRPIIEIAYIAEPGKTGPPVEVQLPAELEPGSYRVIVAPDVSGGSLPGDLEVTAGG
jgi:hypothetical protein